MKNKNAFLGIIAVALAVILVQALAVAPTLAQDAAQPSVARKLGAIKSISGSTITLAPDSGADVTVNVQPNAKLLRIAPGAKDLKDAAPVQLQELQVGDRVRVRGQAAADGSISALEIIVMAHSDIEARHQQEQQDWQKRGMGGLVSSVNPGAGTVTISVTGLSGKKEVTINTTNSTVIRRYAPDSVKFDDAKTSSLADIRPGDQLRARGEKSTDGASMQAEEIVTGSFRNIAGTVNSVDASAGTISVQDLLTKKAVVVKITPESQLHKLPAEFAQRIAMRLKGNLPPGTPGAGGASPSGAAAGHGNLSSGPSVAAGSPAVGGPGMNGSGMGGGMRAGGDFSQFLNRLPAVTLPDLHKGDAILVVATEGNSTSSTAITLLSGVEPILQATPSASQAMMLTPWSLGGAPGGEGMQ